LSSRLAAVGILARGRRAAEAPPSKFDWLASFDKHPQTIVLLRIQNFRAKCCYFPFALILNRELPNEM
jgi:hypothetical protein